MPAIAPLWAVRLAVPLSVLVTPRTEAPDPSILSARLPRPSSLRIPNTWPRQFSSSTSTNCKCEVTATPPSALASPSEPLGDAAESLRFPDRDVELAVAHIGGDCRSTQLRVRDFDAGGREPQIEIEVGEAFQRYGQLIPAAFVGGQQVNPGYIRSEIERIGRERALDGAMVGRERDHAFGGIAVELDIDAGERDHAAADAALRPQREAPKAAERQLAGIGPA